MPRSGAPGGTTERTGEAGRRRRLRPAAGAKRGPSFIDRKLMSGLRNAYHMLSLPLTVVFLFYNRRQHPSYQVSWPDKFALALRMYRNTRRVPTATTYKAHLAMAAKGFGDKSNEDNE